MTDGLERVRDVWVRRTASEYRSATLAAQYSHWLLRLGMPPAVIRQALEVASDEIDHAERCYALYREAGGKGAPAPVPDVWLSLSQSPDDELPYRALAVAVDEYAIAESVALELFRAMAQLDLVPAARQTIDRIVVDEARHAAFGWAALDVLLDVLGDDGRAYLAPRVSGYADRVRSEYEANSRACTALENTWGIVSSARYRELVDAALAGPVARNLARRGLPIAAH